MTEIIVGVLSFGAGVLFTVKYISPLLFRNMLKEDGYIIWHGNIVKEDYK